MKFLFKLYYRLFPLEMVQWWKTKESCQAKVTTDKDGSYIMWMEGEKYPFPGYPRGTLITNEPGKFSPYSKLKHLIKTQIFNDNFYRDEVVLNTKDIFDLAESLKYDFMPVEKCAPSVREVNKWLPNSPWRDILTAVFCEDDAYRWRASLFFTFANPKAPLKRLRTWWNKWTDDEALLIYSAEAFDYLENMETIDDMKERVRLIKTVMLKLWKDEKYLAPYRNLMNGMDIDKVKLTKGDFYFFRAKYHRPDKYKSWFGYIVEAYDY